MSMQPTIGDQLRGIGRTLETTVAPLLGPGYGAEMLRWSVQALGRLAQEVPLVHPFLMGERASTIALLANAIPLLPRANISADLHARAVALVETERAVGLVTEFDELADRLTKLRAMLSEITRVAAFAPGNEELTKMVGDHIASMTKQQP